MTPTPMGMLIDLKIRFECWTCGLFRNRRGVERVLEIPTMGSADALGNLLHGRYDPSRIEDLCNHVFRADGFVFVVDAYREFTEPANGIIAGHATMIQQVRDYRDKHKELGSIKNALVVLTKSDKLRDAHNGAPANLPDIRDLIAKPLTNGLKGASRDGQGPNKADPVVPVPDGLRPRWMSLKCWTNTETVSMPFESWNYSTVGLRSIPNRMAAKSRHTTRTSTHS